jgi:cephalosporin-C deacetylase-like acetyl esterase
MNWLRKTFTSSLSCIAALALLSNASVCPAQEPSLAPLNATGIYQLGERAGWTVAPASPFGPRGSYSYIIRRNNSVEIQSGQVDLSSGRVTIESALNEPAMLYLELKPTTTDARSQEKFVAGAAVAPDKLQPAAARPDDFDAFWESKINLLKQIPEKAMLTSKDVGNSEIEYATIRMDHVNDTHVYGQIARPRRSGKFPALVIFQWASPPYPLQKEWITGHAADGWLVLNIQPHNVPADEPQSYYDALPPAIRNYPTIGQDDRDRSYFLEMYLRGYRAVDYISRHPDWDGRTLVAMGTSMGGQQSLCVAGLHPKITHVLANVPAGCDMNAALHGRQPGYPNFPSDNPKVMETARYFDVVNFAPRITARCLVGMGFVDTACPPAGIWTAFNLIPGPKRAVPMIDSPHNHLATAAQQWPWTVRSAEWLNSLVAGGQVEMPRSSIAATQPVYDDHRHMMKQLGLRALRRGASPNDPNIYDQANANRFMDSLPDVLKFKDGTRVTRAEQWAKRRAELVEDFEREVYGRVPPDVPKITWEITSTTQGETAGIPTVTRTLIGRVDNSRFPSLAVEIQAGFTVPANITSPVPMMIVFGRGTGPGPARRPATARASVGPPWTDQAVTRGWGFGYINPGSIQPDTNKLLTGIIGLTNRGQPRAPDQWGALRAWGWGVSRLIDYFEQHPESMVDPKKVGIEGVSRYGKAALVAAAFDERIGVTIVASSGQGGSKLHRRVYGELVENLAGGGAYHWMAGNYIKYAASDPLMTAADLPVDSHELIALCAPRPCFISHGIPERGDAHWIDARGSFMAGVLASPVYELLGAKGLGITGDYLTEPMPPVGQLIGGHLAWRQHAGGHEFTPNWPAFFEWVGRYIPSEPPPAAR